MIDAVLELRFLVCRPQRRGGRSSFGLGGRGIIVTWIDTRRSRTSNIAIATRNLTVTSNPKRKYTASVNKQMNHEAMTYFRLRHAVQESCVFSRRLEVRGRPGDCGSTATGICSSAGECVLLVVPAFDI